MRHKQARTGICAESGTRMPTAPLLRGAAHNTATEGIRDPPWTTAVDWGRGSILSGGWNPSCAASWRREGSALSNREGGGAAPGEYGFVLPFSRLGYLASRLLSRMLWRAAHCSNTLQSVYVVRFLGLLLSTLSLPAWMLLPTETTVLRLLPRLEHSNHEATT